MNKIYDETISHLLSLYFTQNKKVERFKVTVEPEALRLVKRFEKEVKNEIIPTMPESAVPCLRKAHGQAVRFALGIHAWNHEIPHTTPITAQEMKQGIGVMRAAFDHIRYAYDPCGFTAHSVATKILTSLRGIEDTVTQNRLLDRGTDSTNIQQRIGVKSCHVNNALRLLEDHNILRVYDDSTPNLKVILHPDFYWYGNR